ncbi:5-amino-6-(5-phospho-D-ribitylamino)uracil phosphatase YigB [Aggregatibacter actinomycetemcomitans]|uniref:5-amino-6-(5-phospho-D-ribitylamino)uracil phosphatase YigB n=1 Tax=Aggregatibacter actinomycetemcomitans TaxID=714 RepID=UPI00197C6B2D|nr:5-amino-6-(5-phospho-D-ribitylamino)uracil phosphatase YigB [Aggregatibacter actinomycetemcomitans]MBN6077962.1 5-amino-6-(5-phospho-D-ribitylamino)uracil phosphatase YigB [Aggregatibacter actinomycetemcomitans]
MKFYRTLTPFQVIGFDLDDTLYDNSQVITTAEQEFVTFVQQYCRIADFSLEMWAAYKSATAQHNPLMAEDVTLWRLRSLQALLAERGKSAVEIAGVSQTAMDYFLHWRHQIDVPSQSFAVLQQLKPRYKLVAITNGNVDPVRIGFDQFDLVLRGGKHGRAKPHKDLFLQTAHYFNVLPEQILHVGDNLGTDVQGAIQAGCQSVWLNLSGKDITEFSEVHILPTVEMNELTDLLQLRV